MPDEILDRVYAILLGQTQIAEIEQWIYNCGELESLLTGDDHLALLSLDYRQAGAVYEVRKIVERYVDLGHFETRKLLEVLHSIVASDDNAYTSVEATYDLYCDGYYFLDSDAAQITDGNTCPHRMLRV